MAKLPKNLILYIFISLFVPFSCFAFELENTMDNPRLVNLSPDQHRILNNIEKRFYHKAYIGENTMDRLERLELDVFQYIQKGSPTERLKQLQLESSRHAISGTAMTPMMMDNFNTKYINRRGEGITYKDDVGLIDGLIRAWWPDFYQTIAEYRKYKEASFY